MPRLFKLLPALAFTVLYPALAAAQGALSVKDAYIRLAPPGAPAIAAFMTIANAGESPRRLVQAQSAFAARVELHTSFDDNGVMKMRAVDSIEIPARGEVQLKPGGYHLMLSGLKVPLAEGELVPLVLAFDDGSRQEIDAPVRRQTMSSDRKEKN